MGIQNFPTALQPIIQQGFLEREFSDAQNLESLLGYRQVAAKERFPNRIGETITKTRTGLKAPTTTPINPAGNTNLDNGLTPASWTVEQYTLAINMYGDTIDLNVVTDRVGIKELFLKNARTNAMQGEQSRDRIARAALFNGYMGGNTRMAATLGSAGATIAVDDIRGFQQVYSNGVPVPVSSANPMPIFVNGVSYSCIAATADAVNVSTAPGGVSGTLTASASITVANGTVNNPVIGGYAPTLLRPNGRATTAAITSSDLFTMGLVLDGVTQLRNNAVPTVDGLYNCYLDPHTGRSLFADPDFKLLYQGDSAAKAFRAGNVVELLGVRFIPTTEAYQQSLNGVSIHRPILVGAEALIEGQFDGMPDEPELADQSLLTEVDGIIHVTREPLDRLKQIIAQSWFWIGGYAVPSDVTADQRIIPTASNAYLKRGVVFEVA